LVNFVLDEVSSIKISRANALLKNRLRRTVHNSRARAISGRRCSLARRLFFMAQAKPVKKAAHTGAVRDDAASGKFDAQLIQRQVAILRKALTYPDAMGIQLAASPAALSPGGKRSGLALQDHQIVHKTRRNPEMSRSLAMAAALFNKRNDTDA
jgi:hypothetical protein